MVKGQRFYTHAKCSGCSASLGVSFTLPQNNIDALGLLGLSMPIPLAIIPFVRAHNALPHLHRGRKQSLPASRAKPDHQRRRCWQLPYGA